MNDHRQPAEQLGHASAEQTAAAYSADTAPAPLPPALVSAILRDPDSPYYPSKIVVFCDECGTESARDYMVSTEQTSAERLEVARRHLRAEGWQCDATGDFCPEHRTPPSAVVLAEVAYERARQDQRWGEQNHPDGTGPRVPALVGALCYADEAADRARLACQSAARSGKTTWRLVLGEEVLEALAEDDPAKLRSELLQVAAVAVAWVEAIDRRQAAVERPSGGRDAGNRR
ncbi:hypothetical protein [Streptomyces olivaceoviridis]|uniref:hypothetical protein n=1 Tax=Streptomyces olivaceoviridis TaxID=1921 RepID=UPI0036F9FFAB